MCLSVANVKKAYKKSHILVPLQVRLRPVVVQQDSSSSTTRR